MKKSNNIFEKAWINVKKADYVPSHTRNAPMSEKNKWCQKRFGKNYSDCSMEEKLACESVLSPNEPVKKRD